MLVIPAFGAPRIQVTKKRTMNSRPILKGYRVRTCHYAPLIHTQREKIHRNNSLKLFKK